MSTKSTLEIKHIYMKKDVQARVLELMIQDNTKFLGLIGEGNNYPSAYKRRRYNLIEWWQRYGGDCKNLDKIFDEILGNDQDRLFQKVLTHCTWISPERWSSEFASTCYNEAFNQYSSLLKKPAILIRCSSSHVLVIPNPKSPSGCMIWSLERDGHVFEANIRFFRSAIMFAWEQGEERVKPIAAKVVIAWRQELENVKEELNKRIAFLNTRFDKAIAINSTSQYPHEPKNYNINLFDSYTKTETSNVANWVVVVRLLSETKSKYSSDWNEDSIHEYKFFLYKEPHSQS